MRTPLPPAPPSPDAAGFWGTIGWILEAAFNTLSAPAMWYFELISPAVDLMSTVLEYSIFINIIFFPIFFIVMLFIMYPCLFLFIPVEIDMQILIFLPFFLLGCAFTGLMFLGATLSNLEWKRLPAVVWARAGSAVVLVALLVYYLSFWDSSGTRKAPWTENLG